MKDLRQLLVAAVLLLAVFAHRPNAQAGFVVLDDFEDYQATRLQQMVSSEGWIPHRLTELNRIVEEDGNKFLAVGYHSSTRTASRYLPTDMVVENHQLATLFLRFRVMSDSVEDARFGLANNPTFRRDNDPRSFGPMVGISGAGSTLELRVLNASGEWKRLARLKPATWYNCWVVIDRIAVNGFAVYLTEGNEGADGRHRLSHSAEADGIVGIFPFRDTIEERAPFNYFMASGLVVPSDSVHFDELWLDNRGLNLTNPSVGRGANFSAASSDHSGTSGDWYSVDTSGDGLTDGEVLALGLNPMHDHSGFISYLSENPQHLTGIYTSENMADLALGRPVLQRDPLTGRFHFYMRFQHSENLKGWNSFDLFPENVRTTPDGLLEITFPGSNRDTEFFRLSSAAEGTE